ncbi:MAG: hypothetical protein JSW02_04655, partial [candidate division WOR-3 bacterium]
YGISSHEGPQIGAVLGYGISGNDIIWTLNGSISQPNNGEIEWDDWGATEMGHSFVWPVLCPD